MDNYALELAMGALTKVISLKLFLDIVPSSSADITRVFFFLEDMFMSFRFASK